ncbi:MULTISPECIES: DUF1146 family protein [unclassified Paenibacillus]|uniref:DUF1146 family protein n=1 Tax=unclassified Paenibacillus TaxID=185978 RepID=UPI001AEAEF72|nr:MULTISPECIES: DUF1146 family protein [unclassified Paenibacillus]MBP1157836.1 putative integral membrane protein (TIGR02327 family) [Paenibacillus sp. PvP091]MBP1171428.1 putative integral membrane protein (TIGR02327 family) [Paenibacillus sp. PvR098]MBP2442456.1 putative integral membrane protein (TIGR02327 family) [Paenibacillus sp. PvP052]
MDYLNQMNASMGMKGLLNIALVLVFIGVSWWSLQELKLESILKRPKSTQAKLLQILLSIALGYQTARFVIDYLEWSTWFSGMF